MKSVRDKGFASDNQSGVHPFIMESIIKANAGHVSSYGEDDFTKEVEKSFQSVFGEESAVFFVYNGTGANVVGLQSMLRPYHSVLHATDAHISTDECGAPNRFTGCQFHAIPTKDGKLTPELLKDCFDGHGEPHQTLPKVISITQITEVGTCYSIEEIKALSAFAKKHGMYLHVDGARISNAAVFLKVSLKEMITDAGVDVLSFGGTKNGMMFGEAVVVLNQSLVKEIPFIRKQSMQLASKMRFISVQFQALLKDNLYLTLAKHSNSMAQRLVDGVQKLKKR